MRHNNAGHPAPHGGRRTQRRQNAPVPEVAAIHTAPAHATRGRRVLRHAGRGARFFVLALVPFIVLTVLALGLAYVRLTHGPISLSFLVSPIERSINAVVVGYVAQVEDAIVRLTDDKRLEFRLKNVRFAEPDGDLVASSPLASIEISRKGLLQGRLLPSRVELIRPELFLTYTPGKGLGLSFSAPVATVEDGGKDAVAKPKVEVPPLPVGAGGEHGEAREVALLKKIDFGQLLMRATSETRDPDRAASFLREFGVIDAVLHVESQGHRTTWQLPEAGIDLDNRNSHSIISGRARVASGINSFQPMRPSGVVS